MTTVTEPDHEGWRDVVVHLESHEVALGQLAVLGAEVEVRRPATLRVAVAARAAAVAAHHT